MNYYRCHPFSQGVRPTGSRAAVVGEGNPHFSPGFVTRAAKGSQVLTAPTHHPPSLVSQRHEWEADGRRTRPRPHWAPDAGVRFWGNRATQIASECWVLLPRIGVC
jgi:hypothetical protein